MIGEAQILVFFSTVFFFFFFSFLQTGRGTATDLRLSGPHYIISIGVTYNTLV